MKGIRFGTCVRIAIAVMCMICLSGTMASADFLVAWRDSYKVVRYDDNWNIIGDFAVLSGLKPLGVVQDKATGDVYVRATSDVGSSTAGTILKFDNAGNLVPGWSVTGLGYGKGIAVSDGKLFVSDSSSQTLKWYSTADSSISDVLSSGTDAMGSVEGLAFDSQGKLFVSAGSNVKCWDADLNYVGAILDNSNLTDVKIDPLSDGIRALRWDGYLLGWANDGTWTGPYYYQGVPPYPQALWISPTGDYYRTAAAVGGVQKLDAATGTWETLVIEDGDYWYPLGLTDFQVVPEPSALLALAVGGIGFMGFARRRK